jgi:hypothetical protein
MPASSKSFFAFDAGISAASPKAKIAPTEVPAIRLKLLARQTEVAATAQAQNVEPLSHHPSRLISPRTLFGATDPSQPLYTTKNWSQHGRGLDSSEQIGPGLAEPHERAAVMQFEPAALDGELETRRILRRRAPIDVQERTVDLLDIDAAILHHFEGMGVLHQTACRPFGISEGTVGCELHVVPVTE